MPEGVGDVYRCLYVKTYKFRRCLVPTCKFNSVDVPSGCLHIDRVAAIGNRYISDAEIKIYKLPEYTQRNVALIRKKSVDRIKNVIIFNEFIQWLSPQTERREFVKSKQMEFLESKFPYRSSLVGFKSWMWPFVADADIYARFVAQHKGECSQVTQASVLFLTEPKLENLRRGILESKK